MTKRNGKKLTKKIIFAIVAASIIGVILITALGLQIGFSVADKIECWRPDYDKQDITDILEKSELTDDDYELLYSQTGLTKIGIDRALERGASGKRRIMEIQEDFFEERVTQKSQFAPFVCTDYADKPAMPIYLKKGDIIITSSTHISGVRIGHAGLVADGDMNTVLEANAYGTFSKQSSASEFFRRINFMVFRVSEQTADRDTVEKIVDYTEENLLGIPYEGLAGIFTDKNKIDKTQCAHLIWYAFNQFGIDLDSNGGLLVTPYDMSHSPHLELVQVFGFDPETLW